MWTYETFIDWKAGKTGEVRAEGKPSFAVATPPEFGGPKNNWTPEDLLAAAVGSCIMTSTLFFAERAKISMRSYKSKAVATMEKTPKGLAITTITVAITVGLHDAAQSDAMRKAVAQAENNCPVSASLNGQVELGLTLE